MKHLVHYKKGCGCLGVCLFNTLKQAVLLIISISILQKKARKSPTPLYHLHLELYYNILCGACNDVGKGLALFPILTHSSDTAVFCCPYVVFRKKYDSCTLTIGTFSLVPGLNIHFGHFIRHCFVTVLLLPDLC